MRIKSTGFYRIRNQDRRDLVESSTAGILFWRSIFGPMRSPWVSCKGGWFRNSNNKCEECTSRWGIVKLLIEIGNYRIDGSFNAVFISSWYGRFKVLHPYLAKLIRRWTANVNTTARFWGPNASRVIGLMKLLKLSMAILVQKREQCTNTVRSN